MVVLDEDEKNILFEMNELVILIRKKPRLKSLLRQYQENANIYVKKLRMCRYFTLFEIFELTDSFNENVDVLLCLSLINNLIHTYHRLIYFKKGY